MKAKLFEFGFLGICGRGLYLPAVLILLTCLVGCGDSSVPSDLDQGRNFIRYLASHKFLKRSSFTMGRNLEPSGFVEWVFSDLGKAEWPGIKPKGISDSVPLKQKVDVFAPTRPEGVALVPDDRDPEKGKQVVVRADDEKGLIIVEGYLDPSSEPVFVDELPLPAF